VAAPPLADDSKGAPAAGPRRSSARRLRRLRPRVRAVVLLHRDPPPLDRDRAPPAISRAAARGALGAVRRARGRPSAYLGRARAGAIRPVTRGGDLERDRARRTRRGGLPGGGAVLRALHPCRRTRRRNARPHLAFVLRLLLRLPLLGRSAALVDLPRSRRRPHDLPPRPSRLAAPAGLGARRVAGRARSDRPV